MLGITRSLSQSLLDIERVGGGYHSSLKKSIKKFERSIDVYDKVCDKIEKLKGKRGSTQKDFLRMITLCNRRRKIAKIINSKFSDCKYYKKKIT